PGPSPTPFRSESPPWHARESRSEDCDPLDYRQTNRPLLQTSTESSSMAPSPRTHPLTRARASPARSTSAQKKPASLSLSRQAENLEALCPIRPATADVASDTIDRPVPDTWPCTH